MNKTKLLITIITVLLINALILSVITSSNNGKNQDREKNKKEELTIESIYNEFGELGVKDIDITYYEDETETRINFSILNLTEKDVEHIEMQIQFVDEQDEIISEMPITIEVINANDSYKVPITILGKITGIEKMKLLKPE